MPNVRHGGDRAEGAALTGVRPWLDLSTGINPHAYPMAFDPEAAHALPQRSDEERLIAAARHAYAVPAEAAIVAAPGTQAILQWLPVVRPAQDVTILAPTYGEHAALWAASGARVQSVSTLDAASGGCVVVVNPNNPDGRLIAPGALTAFAAQRPPHPPRLIVDEAFMDVAPAHTVAGAPGTLVLRSFGKFYGLAGLRLGFAIGNAHTIGALRQALGPWAVSGPALHAGATALADTAWRDQMRQQLAAERHALDRLLTDVGLSVVGGTDLYRLVETAKAPTLHRQLAKAGIWTRRFDSQPNWLRIGLPGGAFAPFRTALIDAAAAL